MTVSVATYLGQNSVHALRAIVEELRELTSIGFVFDQTETLSSTYAREHASQTDLLWLCGHLCTDLTTTGKLAHDVIAAPVFEGESAAVYRSIIIARNGGPSSLETALQSTVAINELESWSGHLALRRHVAPRWFKESVISGSHRSSIELLAAGKADCAAIDHTIWNELRSEDGIARQVNMIGATIDCPAPPFILRRSVDSKLSARLVSALCSLGPVPGVSTIQPALMSTYNVMAHDRNRQQA